MNAVNLRLIEEVRGVRLIHRRDRSQVYDSRERVEDLLALVRGSRHITTPDVRYALREAQRESGPHVAAMLAEPER